MDIERPAPLARSFVRAAAVALAMLAAGRAFAAPAPGPAEFQGRGVFPFHAAVPCPFAAPGGDDACNRVALDDADTRATLDAPAHVIRFSNPRAYAAKAIVADVLLQGSGRGADGRRVPLNFHLVLSKSGTGWSMNSHAHAPVRGEFTDVAVDAWRIEAGDPRAGGLVVTPQAIRDTLARPGLMARVASDLVEVSDNRSAAHPAPDMTVRLGIGAAALPVMRASLQGDPVGGDGLAAMLRRGTWTLTLHALSGHLPQDVVRRELFLFGMGGQPALRPLAERGFRADESLVVGAVAGKGYLRFGDRRQDFPAAATTGLAFMQQSFIGLVLGAEQAGAAP